jgi:hypothetical protein
MQLKSNVTNDCIDLKGVCVFYFVHEKYCMALLYQSFYNFITQIFYNLSNMWLHDLFTSESNLLWLSLHCELYTKHCCYIILTDKSF